jgi:phosphatidylserine synthase
MMIRPLTWPPETFAALSAGCGIAALLAAFNDKTVTAACFAVAAIGWGLLARSRRRCRRAGGGQ